MADRPRHGDGSAPDQPRRRGLVGGVIGLVAPAVMRQIDTNDLVDALDVDVIAADLDLDALIGRLDVNAIAADLDLDALIERLDVNAIAADLDLDALIERLDVNAIADRLDLDPLMRRIDMAQLTAGATQDVALSGLDLARRQMVRLDVTVDGVFDRLLRREPGQRPDAPTRFAEAPTEQEEVEPTEQAEHEATVVEPPQRRDVSGHYAGPVTRAATLAADLFGALTTFGVFGAVTLYLLSTFLPVELTIDSGGWVSLVLLSVWWMVWYWMPVALFGRTAAMALTGVAVVRRDGGFVNSRRAFLRAIVLPLSFLSLFLGLIGIVLGRERRTLHDVIAGTVVIYDWGARQAEQPVTIREQLSARAHRNHD